ncbi:MAG: capsule assembly Wzi family protein [Pseudomonadota bacterium]|nr:capsule assembly Wzi family protein [Pseudomonadota bacterium]
MPGHPHINIRRLGATVSCALLAFTGSSLCQAGPWINPGDETLRHHIQVLSDARVIRVPVTTWPLMWSGIKSDLESADTSQLSNGQLMSLSYVRFALRRDTSDDVRLTFTGGLRQDPNLFTNFADSQRDPLETTLSADWMGKHLAGQLSVSYTDDVNGDPDAKLDGSYLSAILGNWAFTAGAQERWWGPGWQNSLILGTNARPAPSIGIQRNHSYAFDTPWLSWIGPWHLETFMAQLENDRYVSDALLWGLRITFRPFDALEVGLTRTAQWGGEGRPQDWGTFTDLLLGKDNRGDDDIDESNEPGNQLGGIDWRLSGTVLDDVGVGFYGQWIGEDETNSQPTAFVMLMGLDVSVLANQTQHRAYLEYSDTLAEGFKPDHPGKKNYAYEHGIYRSGYRYRNRTIGSSVDNDSRILTLAHDMFILDDMQFGWSASYIKLNMDGSDASPPGGHTLSRDNTTKLWDIGAHYRLLLNPWQLTVGLNYQSEELTYAGDTLDGTSAYFAWEARW